MRVLFVVLLIVLLSASAVFAAVPFGEAEVVTSADIVLSPLSATIHVGEAIPFTVTVPKIIEATAYCQWFLDGVKVRNQNYPTWTFVSTTTGSFSVSVFVGWYNASISAGSGFSYINGTAENSGIGGAGFMSQPANVLVTTSSPTGSFGYPYTTMSGGGFGDKYVARGSRFALNVKANVTFVTALLSAFGRETPSSCKFTYAIYNDKNGSVGTLAAQTPEGQLPDMMHLNWYWETLAFPSPVPLDPGFYWLMVVDNGNGNGSVSMGDDIVANVTSVYARIGSMTFPNSLESPVYQQMYAQNVTMDIFASYRYDPNVPPVNLGTNPTPTSPSQTPAPDPQNSTSPTQPASLLAISCHSISSTSFQVEINGNLSYYNSGISQVPVLLSYSVNYGTSWIDLTTVITDNNGGFTADWTPSATGTYLIRAVFTGNNAYPGASTTVNFVLAPSEGQSDFSVTSNSTLTAFVFDSVNKQLSFTIIGPQGTTGYVEISIPKSIIGDISKLQVKLDDQQIAYSSESHPDYWLVTFNYHHSTHTVSIDLTSAAGAPSISHLAIYVVVITAVTVAAFLVTRTKIKNRNNSKT